MNFTYFKLVATSVLFAALAACGGGTSSDDPSVFQESHQLGPSSGPLAAVASPTIRMAAAIQALDATSFLNWAEIAYPSLFEAPQSNKTINIWTYRYYPKTDIYLGTNTSGDVLGLMGRGDGQYDSYPLGKITDYGCSVYPADCATVNDAPVANAVVQSLVTVSSDISANAYPSSYTTVANVATVNDQCIYTESSVQYLAADRGTTALPAIQPVASLKGLGTLSISPTDFYDVPNAMRNGVNPTLDTACGPGDMRRAFTTTLLRAKALGASTITMYDSRSVDDVTNFQKLVRQFIPDAELVFMAQQAQANGMKIRYKIQIDAIDNWDNVTGIGGRDLNTYLNTLNRAQQTAWMNTMFTQYATHLKHMATIMAQNPTAYEAIEIDWGYWTLTDWAPFNAARYGMMTRLSDDIRAIYPWKQWITSGTIAGSGATIEDLQVGAQALIDKVDVVEIMPVGTRTTTAQENSTLTVSVIKGIFATYLPNWLKTLNKPLMWTIQTQSKNNYFSGTFFEGCPPNQPFPAADYGTQAVGYAAFLEIIRDYSTTGINGTVLLLDSVNSTGYAWSDTMLPYTTQLQCNRAMQSIRNKPAEAIVYNWFK